MYNVTHRRMFTSKVWTGDRRRRILAARQSRRAPHHVIKATTSEGLAIGLYVAACGMRTSDLPRRRHLQWATTTRWPKWHQYRK